MRIIDAVSIDQRPKNIELCEEVGHWEGDLVIGAKYASAIGILVERKTSHNIFYFLLFATFFVVDFPGFRITFVHPLSLSSKCLYASGA